MIFYALFADSKLRENILYDGILFNQLNSTEVDKPITYLKAENFN